MSEEAKQSEFGVYGSRNPEQSWVDVKTVASAVRVDIRHAQTLNSDDPMRPPAGIKVSVKISRESRAQSGNRPHRAIVMRSGVCDVMIGANCVYLGINDRTSTRPSSASRR